MRRPPPRSTRVRSSAASDVYKRQVLDAAILARLEATWGPRTKAQRSPAWIERQLGKVIASVKAMSHGLGDKAFCAGIYFSLADIAVGVALGYLDFRFPQIDWRI